MGFLIFIPIILIGGVAGLFLEKVLTPFLPLLEFLLDPVVFNVAVGSLLAFNLLLLVLLLAVCIRLGRDGRLSRAYINCFCGMQRVWRALGKGLLAAGITWEVIVVVFCAVCLAVQPLQNVSTPNSGPEDPVHFLWGTWEITGCAAVTPSCTLTQEELDGYIGAQVHYNGYDYQKDGQRYTKTQLFLTGDTEYQITGVSYREITGETMVDELGLSLAGLGDGDTAVFQAVLHLSGGDEQNLLLGQEIFSIDGTIYLYHRGALFRTAEALFYGGPIQF